MILESSRSGEMASRLSSTGAKNESVATPAHPEGPVHGVKHQLNVTVVQPITWPISNSLRTYAGQHTDVSAQQIKSTQICQMPRAPPGLGCGWWPWLPAVADGCAPPDAVARVRFPPGRFSGTQGRGCWVISV